MDAIKKGISEPMGTSQAPIERREEGSWVKFGRWHDFVFIGRDTLATASGVHVRFLDCRTRQARIERFDDEDRGDGVSSIAGHPVVSVFSVVERRACPRITVFSYPAIRRISVCSSQTNNNGYLGCTFAGSDYLLGLATYPDFRLIVWQWRTGEMISAIQTVIREPDRQTISSTAGPPHLIAQFAETSGEISVYRLLVHSRTVRLLPVEIPPVPTGQRILSFGWSTEANLLVCDERSNLYLVDLEAGRVLRISENPLISVDHGRPVIISYKTGLVVMGSTKERGYMESKAIFLKRVSMNLGEDWRPTWTIPLRSHPTCARIRADNILVHVKGGEILEIAPPTRERAARLDCLYRDGTKFEILSSTLIQGRYVCLVDDENRLNVHDSVNGSAISSGLNLSHHGKVLCAQSHVSLTTLITVSETGSCLFVDLSSVSSPTVSGCLHVQTEPLDRIKFSEEGEVLGIAGSDHGRLFLLSRNRHSVVGYICLHGQKIYDFLLYKLDQTRIKVLVLLGNKIMVCSCEIGVTFRETKDRIIELSSRFECLHYSGGRTLEIIGVPRLSRQLHAMEIKNDFGEIHLTEALQSMHRMRSIGLNSSTASHRFLSYGYDGLIIIRDSFEPRKVLSIFSAHHRAEAGIRAAIIAGDAVVALARNGDLLGFKVRTDGKATKEVRGVPFGYSGVQEVEGETWLEAVSAEKAKADTEKFLVARSAVLNRFRELKTRIGRLLDANEKEPAESRLPISIFDLDKEARRRKMAESEAQRELVRRDAEDSIRKRGQAAAYLRRKYWDPLIVHPCSILSIFDDLKVTNYSLKEPKETRDGELAWTKFLRETRDLSFGTDSEITGGHPVWVQNSSVRLTRELLNPYRGYVHCLEMNTRLEQRELITKRRFNDRFEEVRSLKMIEMENAVNRIGRLRDCAEELRNVFGLEVRIDLEAPRWKEEETPDSIVTVRDQELTKDTEEFPGSGSKSTTGSEDWRDEFRSTALERMMDGVLEIRWEDNLKKDLAKPDCLIAKDPARFTEEDLESVRRYEEKLRALEEDRLKYRRMLEEEIARTEEATWNGVKSFNETLKDLHWRKIEADRWILRDKLARARTIHQHERIVRKKIELARVIEKELEPASREARRFQDDCVSVESAVQELKNRQEVLCKREKMLEAKFRSEFPDLKQPMVEHLFRHYRRRPRASARTSTSVLLLLELARCVTGSSGLREILPRDCLELLRGLDNLDAMPDSLPAQIEVCHWQSMCRLRRIMIETEIKMRCCTVEIAEAEQTLSVYQKVLFLARGRVHRCKDKVQDLERSLTEERTNSECRLVLKTGQVEVRLKGEPSDLEDAVLVRGEELVRVNERIEEEGARKLSVLRKLIELRKRIALEEWRHSCAKLKMRNLQEGLEDLKSAKITRLCRECTRRDPYSGILEDEEETSTERNLTAMKNRLREIMEEEIERTRSLQREIVRRQRENEKLDEDIEKCKTEIGIYSREGEDPSRLRAVRFEGFNMAAIVRKTWLERRIQANVEELLTLKGTLEVYKLRTYPTLSFNG